MKRTIVIAWIAVLIGFTVGYFAGSHRAESQNESPTIAGGSHTGNAIEQTAEKTESTSANDSSKLDNRESDTLLPAVEPIAPPSPSFLAVPGIVDSAKSTK